MKGSVDSLKYARLFGQPFSGNELSLLRNPSGNLARVMRSMPRHSSFDHIRARSDRHGGHVS